MKKINLTVALLSCLTFTTTLAQQKKTIPSNLTKSLKQDSLSIPISNADLGVFPYFKTLPNFYVNDSVTYAQNRTYFYNGKNFVGIDGKVSAQSVNVYNRDQKHASEYQCIQEFDKVISTLGGIKIYTGKLPEAKLKEVTGQDIITLASKGQIAPSAYYGVVEYVIKTPEKEVWIQLQPYSLDSKFYTLLIVEKQTPLVTLNTNKVNIILNELTKTKKSVCSIMFELDTDRLQTDSKDELLNLLGVFQANPDWKLKIECHNAPLGSPEYNLTLTQKRAAKIKQELVDLGVNPTSIEANGFGDQKPIVTNNTEQGRTTNTRLEIILK